jgi:hypothetical protein
MADRKISDLTALTTPASGDYLPIVDISEGAAASKNKRITIEELMRGVPDGTAAAPGIAFETDPNTGIYSPGADQLAVSTGGTGRLFISSTGLVGIGTSVIDSRLTIKATASGDAAFQIKRYDNDNAYQVGLGQRFVSGNGGMLDIFAASGALTGNLTSSQLAMTVGHAGAGIGYSDPGTARLAVNGNVGIGTTSPGSALEINAAVATSPFIAKINTAEAARIDSSGRLLVGTSTTSQGSRAVFQGYSGDATGPGIVRLAAGSATPANDTDLGSIEFSDSGHVSSARVIATRDGGAWTSGSSHPSRFVFSTTADGASSPTERMRITSSGTVNTFGSTADAFVSRSSSAAGTTNYNIRCTYSATGTLDGTVAFQVSTNGNVTNTNNSYGAISDIKLKENIVDATPQWNDIKALQVRKYNFKKGQTHTQIGLVAQEVELISPGLVTESPDCDEEGNDLGTVTKSVNYSVLYMKAVKALQEAMERIETLEAAVASLSG